VPASSPQTRGHEGKPFCEDLYYAICSQKGETRDPTGAVFPELEGEIQALRIYEEVIRQHPDWAIELIDETMAKRIYTPKPRAKLQSAFQWVNQVLRVMIESQPDSVFSPREKRVLKHRIQEVKLQIPPPAALYADEPDMLTKNDVFYERLADGRTRMRVGGAFVFTSKSWFNMVFTFAHEMGHVIDPCETRSAGLAFPAYDRLTACFLRQGLIETGGQRRECAENDQLSEVFADWIAVRVTERLLREFASEFKGKQLLGAVTNSVRDLCEQDTGLLEEDLAEHPTAKVRIEKIFGLNPKLRKILNCPELTTEYCSWGGE